MSSISPKVKIIMAQIHKNKTFEFRMLKEERYEKIIEMAGTNTNNNAPPAIGIG